MPSLVLYDPGYFGYIYITSVIAQVTFFLLKSELPVLVHINNRTFFFFFFYNNRKYVSDGQTHLHFAL